MIAHAITASCHDVDLNSEATWNELYSSLRSLTRYLVYSSHVSSWYGQEEDVVDDIVQETARRLFERARKAERGEAEPIHSLKQMMIVIAQNYCKDLKRSDRRLSRMQDDASETVVDVDEQEHTLDEVTEQVYQELIFMAIAHEIANFPDKQRKALLIDLANRMYFDTGATPLQKAFLREGIQLKQYQQPLPADPRARSRHAATLSYAYRRVASLSCAQEYISM